MKDKLYKLMNWPLIESVIYKESIAPHDILGAHRAGSQTLVQAFFPDAEKVSVHWCKTEKSSVENTIMELADDDGFWACILPTTSVYTYFFRIIKKNGDIKIINDAYRFGPTVNLGDVVSFSKGINYRAFETFGAKLMTFDGVKGCAFSVWAPEALGVSVVGDFNDWDSRIHQMRKLQSCDVFEIFIPDVEAGDRYKFEIRCKGGLVVLKSDPFARATEKGTEGASIVCCDESIKWTDDRFVKNRAKENAKPFSVYRFCPQGYRESLPEDVEYSWSTLADHICDRIKEIGYTHVEFTPIMSYVDDASYGFDTFAYYSCDERIGKAAEIKELIDRLHGLGVGVFLDWNAVGFGNHSAGLSDYIGKPLFEYSDPNKNIVVGTGKKQFDYCKGEVTSFLLSNAFYWIEEFHFDGLRLNSLDAMLYLDYGKMNDHCVNIYGGVENLEAIEFVKHLNSMMEKRNPGVVMIADSYAYPGVTESFEQNGLGFDMKLNYGFASDYREYIKYDPIFRGAHHDSLTSSTVYANAEKFILSLNPEAAWGRGGLTLDDLSGEPEQKRSDYRLSLCHMFAHPGRKLINMGQDVDQDDPGLNKLVRDLNKLYSSESALHSRFHEPDCFAWIDNMGRENCYLSYIRKGIEDTDILIVVANFSGLELNARVGVPFEGKYKEVLNSDNELYGGSNIVNPRVKNASDKPWDGRNQSIQVKLAPRSMSILKFIPYSEEELKKVIESRVRQNLPAKKNKSTKKK